MNAQADNGWYGLPPKPVGLDVGSLPASARRYIWALEDRVSDLSQDIAIGKTQKYQTLKVQFEEGLSLLQQLDRDIEVLERTIQRQHEKIRSLSAKIKSFEVRENLASHAGSPVMTVAPFETSGNGGWRLSPRMTRQHIRDDLPNQTQIPHRIEDITKTLEKQPYDNLRNSVFATPSDGTDFWGEVIHGWATAASHTNTRLEVGEKTPSEEHRNEEEYRNKDGKGKKRVRFYLEFEPGLKGAGMHEGSPKNVDSGSTELWATSYLPSFRGLTTTSFTVEAATFLKSPDSDNEGGFELDQ
ncbi:hypothetical protein QBC41DRAFT_300495 [Cercophora samala]|uniref:Uncharacterized protein n=1 Tax=Cercophora samala TaxID=330535 RepID=A0AA39ZI85_9PEZI|nr:hypothetical protein QBC41DRAFT_300495 [Cercophora samala]